MNITQSATTYSIDKLAEDSWFVTARNINLEGVTGTLSVEFPTYQKAVDYIETWGGNGFAYRNLTD